MNRLGSPRWPTAPGELERLQLDLAQTRPRPWVPVDRATVGGCFVCFARGGRLPGSAGERGWASAVVLAGARTVSRVTTVGESAAPYLPGLLAAREGPLLEAAVRALPHPPDVLLVNATGLDHPRRAGLALQLGWVLDLPTVGVTHRPLTAVGEEPRPWPGSRSPLHIDGEQVGWWLRTRPGTRPVAISPGWRTGIEEAARVVMDSVRQARTPEPIRRARRMARTTRAAAASRSVPPESVPPPRRARGG